MSYETQPENYSPAAVGWAMFAAIMLGIVGVMDVIQGIVALVNDDFLVVGAGWAFEFNTTAWGWIHILTGVVLIAAAFGIVAGNVLGRTVGVIVAAVTMIANFAYLPYYPIWSITIIAICIAVIWALTVHGRDITYR